MTEREASSTKSNVNRGEGAAMMEEDEAADVERRMERRLLLLPSLLSSLRGGC